VVVSDSDRVETASEPARREEVGPLDEAELLLRAGPAGEEGGDRQEEVVDELGRDERGEETGPRLAEDASVAAGAQGVDRSADVDRSGAGDDLDLCRRLDPAGEPPRTALGSPDQRAVLNGRMRGVDGAAAGDDRDRRVVLVPQAATELGEVLRRGGEDRLRLPAALGRGVHRAAADEDDVRGGAQEPHHEAVGLAAADQRVRAR